MCTRGPQERPLKQSHLQELRHTERRHLICAKFLDIGRPVLELFLLGWRKASPDKKQQQEELQREHQQEQQQHQHQHEQQQS